MVILDGALPLGIGYWYMKQSVEMGWSSNVLKIQIETNNNVEETESWKLQLKVSNK